jgi:hypothetical protein
MQQGTCKHKEKREEVQQLRGVEEGCVPGRSLGTQIGLGRGRQNERDLAMVKDPLIDFEEVVVGT